MGKSKLYDCLHCEGSNSVCVEINVDTQGVKVLINKCRKCFQFHNIKDNGTLEKYYIDDTNLSHSPTEPDTLIEGDWFQGTEEEYRKVLEIFGMNCYTWIRDCVKFGVTFDGYILTFKDSDKKTQLTAQEFIRRAENTFKNIL